MLKIVPVDSKKLLKRFIMLPFALYKDDPIWVPPLIMDQYKLFDPHKNPYYEHSKVQLYLAIEDDKVLGRISAHTNTQHQKEHNEDIGFFGFFDCVDRADVARALFEAAGAWNHLQGFAAMRGPMNFSVNQEVGLLIDGFDTSPMVMMRHDHPYYQKLYEACGLEKTMDLYAYLSERTKMPERIERLAAAIEKRSGVSVRSLSKNKKELQKDIETVFEIYTKAWEYNWGNVPMTKAEFDHIVAELMPLADPDLIFIAEKDGHPAGFSLALPNYNEVLKVMKGRVNLITMIKALIAKKNISSARVITMGIIKEYQGRGIDSLLYYYSYKNGLPKGLLRGEFSWVLENNTMMIRTAQMLDAIPYKTYRIYDKSI
ncbi:MAG: GNAT family N-acetyltransferase [Candidatus Cloacimonadaceae bacterium]|jgi:GNAT superfamily N-acetyltransferase|nr:GNAT family N-acetyltransferase [Candidatus Cloacimonadota bacterium]MDY0127364.1 GNAT family N-acetyltransferase [Candidatus Cloacimonadaceae bacterium]MCB5255320.1 GNAT family N-acetyltransferase [Candidatus Cloacimonadota bacterium]MCK9178531.1 GNAT family N-acetyltransferase [Candidatus Cloacimonadota bacterium]MCK9242637.1 GNAT family N-acetyltransferase [Candidatus Cloacimonadota bacterium]